MLLKCMHSIFPMKDVCTFIKVTPNPRKHKKRFFQIPTFKCFLQVVIFTLTNLHSNF